MTTPDQPRYVEGPPRAYRPVPCRCKLQWEGWFAVEEVPLTEAAAGERREKPKPETEGVKHERHEACRA